MLDVELLREVRVVRHQHHGDLALLRYTAHQLHDLGRDGWIEADERLVQYDDPLALRKDLSQRRAPEHAARELPGHLWPICGPTQATASRAAWMVAVECSSPDARGESAMFSAKLRASMSTPF